MWRGWDVRLLGRCGGSCWIRGCHAVCVLVQGAPIFGGDHQSLCVAVSPVPAECAGGRGNGDSLWRPGRVGREDVHSFLVALVVGEVISINRDLVGTSWAGVSSVGVVKGR
jgi:hypothetical protein